MYYNVIGIHVISVLTVHVLVLVLKQSFMYTLYYSNIVTTCTVLIYMYTTHSLTHNIASMYYKVYVLYQE